MKKFMKSLMLVAAAAMALTSCQNEEMDSIKENNTFTLSFTADAPESRTSVAIDGETAKFSWSVDENGALTDRIIFLQTQDANDKVNTKYSDAEESTISNGIATFVSDFDKIDGATEYNYCAIYPATATSGPTSLDAVVAKLPATQTLTENNIDAASDLMMSQLIEGVTTQDGHGGNLKFQRLAAIGRMNLKGVPAGETIEKVTITFADDAVLNGNVTINFNEETAAYATTGSNVITLNGQLTAAAETPIFFTCFPVEYTGAYTFDVETNKAFYQKTGSIKAEKPLTFTAGNVIGFSTTVAKTADKATDKVYTKVTNANLADYSGEYLLVYEAGNVAFDGSLTTLDAASNGFEVTIKESTITGDYTNRAFTIAKVEGGYSVKSASGYYIGNNSSSSNDLNSGTTYTANDYLNTIDNCVLKGKGGLALQYNATSGQTRFRYYKPGQQTVSLYRLNGSGSDEEIQVVDLATPKNLKATAEDNVVTVTWDAVENATSYDVAVVGGATTNVTTNKATLTLDYETEYTINVVAKGGVGYNNSAAATCKVTTGEKPAGGSTVTGWVKISALSELAVGDKIVLVGTTGNGSYSMKTNGTGSAPTAVKVTISDNMISDVSGITTFNIGKSGSNYILYEGETTNTWLYCTSTNNGVRSGTNSNKTWTVTNHTKGNFAFQHVGTSRFLGIYNNADWRCYTSVDAGNFTNTTGTSNIAIYKYVSGEGGTETPAPTPEDQTVTFTTAPTTVEVGKTVTVEATAQTAITYSSNNSNIATVDANGVVTGKAAGTVIITATAAPTDKYNQASATHTITVTAASTGGDTKEEVTATLSFANKAQRTTFTTEQQVWEQNGITFTNDKASSSNTIADYANPARLYANSSVTIEAPGNITKIVFTANNSSYATALKNSIGSEATASGSTVTVIPVAGASTYTIAKLSAQVRLNSLTVTYEK